MWQNFKYAANMQNGISVMCALICLLSLIAENRVGFSSYCLAQISVITWW